MMLHNWLFSPGFPVVLAELREQSQEVVLTQQPFTNSAPNGTKWWIPVSYITKDSPDHVRYVILNGSAPTSIQWSPEDNLDWIKLNINGSGFLRVSYTGELWGRLAAPMKSGALNEVDVATLEYDASLVRPDPPPAAGALAGRLKADDAEITREIWVNKGYVEITREIWVDKGYLVHGAKRTLIGTKASDLQKLIDALPPATPLANVTALVNSSQLRRLRLSGDYTGDVTLHLPSLFVLALDEGATCSASAAGIGDTNTTALNLVQANGTWYTAVVGGHFDCSALPPGYYGVTGIIGTHVRAFTITKVKVSNCGLGRNYSTGNVMVQNGDNGEVSRSEFTGGSRGIWLERNTGLAVHHNWIHECGPLCDVDNGNHGVLLYSNIMENTAAYGMWLEVSASDCFVFNNTIRNASFAIVAVSGAGHRFVGNRLVDPNCDRLIDGKPFCGNIVFGTSEKTTKKGDIFASNTISGNKSYYPPGSQGNLVDNWFFDNDFVGATDDEVFGRYLETPVTRLSIFDYEALAAATR